MIRCPRCHSWDVNRSRTRNVFERALALGTFAPRRCSACGWRGFRFGRTASESPARDVSPEERRRRLQAEAQEASRRRRALRPPRVRRDAAKRNQALAFALAVGMSIGIFAHSCAGM
ncbi:MAG: hypothetical protein ACK4N5_26440 [Myxococcales bacterium]